MNPIDAPIRLHRAQARAGDPRRLNLFAGRALGERDFERLQAYVDDRVEPLLAALGPGIVQGLEVRGDGSGDALTLHVLPGLGVAGNGALVRLADALAQRWPELAAQAERELDAPLHDGLYRLTLRHGVEAIDAEATGEPATRTEPDPLREALLESVTLLGLRPAVASPRWLAWPRERAANRLLARHVAEPPYRADDASLSIGLVKVVARLPVWLDPLAGRWLAGPDSGARALLAHTRQVLAARQAEWQQARALAPAAPAAPALPTGPAPTPVGGLPGSLLPGLTLPGLPGALPAAELARAPARAAVPMLPLDRLLGIDHLPAATPLPAMLLPDPAARRPALGFQPADLQIDLVPVPASAVSGVLAAELPRGTIALAPGARARIRLLLAVADADYRPDLLDLPARERALEDRLFLLGMAARQAHADWRQQWQRLFRGASADGQRLQATPPELDAVPAPPEPATVRDALVQRRSRQNPDEPLPEPYASHVGAPYPPPAGWQPVPMTDASGSSVLARLEAERAAIAALADALEQGYQLLNELNDYLGLQRQHLDVISASFSALGDGVPGDGSGAKTVRWVSQLQYRKTAG